MGRDETVTTQVLARIMRSTGLPNGRYRRSCAR
ncbi:hypothetical protein [Rothia sp. ZJ932]